jgi:hypothetical protein
LERSLTITVTAAPTGEVASLTVGLAKLFDGPLVGGHLRQLDQRLSDAFTVQGTLDGVLLRVGKSLDFDELMKIIEICRQQQTAAGDPVEKFSFVELDEK